jgi:WD40 repeat protein
MADCHNCNFLRRKKTKKRTETIFSTFLHGVAVALDVGCGTGLFAVGCGDLVVILDLGTGDEVARFSAHSDAVSCVRFASRFDGGLLSGSWDATVRRWSVVAGTEVWTAQVDGKVTAVAELGDGRVAFGCLEGSLGLLDGATGAGLRGWPGHAGRVAAIAPGSAGWASGSVDGSIWVWGEELLFCRELDDREPVLCLAWRDDLLVAGGAGGTVLGLRVVAGQERGSWRVSFSAELAEILGVAFVGARHLAVTVGSKVDLVDLGPLQPAATGASLCRRSWRIRCLAAATSKVGLLATAEDGSVIFERPFPAIDAKIGSLFSGLDMSGGGGQAVLSLWERVMWRCVAA